jgi:hypothetical protein
MTDLSVRRPGLLFRRRAKWTALVCLTGLFGRCAGGGVGESSYRNLARGRLFDAHENTVELLVYVHAESALAVWASTSSVPVSGQVVFPIKSARPSPPREVCYGSAHGSFFGPDQ